MHVIGDLLILVLFVFSAVVLLVMFFIYPWVIKGCIRKYTSLKDGTLKNKIELETQKTSLKVADICMIDASKETAHSNAYVSGLGPSRKIVIFDNLVTQLAEDEIVAVVNHELGHVAHYHTIKNAFTNIIVIALSLGVFALIDQRKSFI